MLLSLYSTGRTYYFAESLIVLELNVVNVHKIASSLLAFRLLAPQVQSLVATATGLVQRYSLLHSYLSLFEEKPMPYKDIAYIVYVCLTLFSQTILVTLLPLH